MDERTCSLCGIRFPGPSRRGLCGRCYGNEKYHGRLADHKRQLGAHRQSGTPEHRTWAAMRARCTEPDHPWYPDYGGRGITVCARWLEVDGFANFLEDMGPRPEGDYSIDRIDNDGNYEPGNCRWATRSQQQRNKRESRSVRKLTLHGRTQTIKAWAEELGVRPDLIGRRLRHGWSVEDALTRPVDTTKGNRPAPT